MLLGNKKELSNKDKLGHSGNRRDSNFLGPGIRAWYGQQRECDCCYGEREWSIS
jgi:hypothetical protein